MLTKSIYFWPNHEKLPATYQNFSLTPSSNLCWLQNTPQGPKEMVASLFTFLGSWKVKKGYEVWITDLGLNKAAAIISHTLKTHYRNNDILVISGFIFMQMEENMKVHKSIMSKFPAQNFQWFPTGFRVKSEPPPLDFHGSAGRASAASLILFHSTFLLVGYAPSTMDIVFVPGTCLSHFLLMAFALGLPAGILLPTLHSHSLTSYRFQSHKKAFPDYPILKSHSVIH